MMEYKDELYEVSCALASLQALIDNFGIEIGKCPKLDEIYNSLSAMENDLDRALEHDRAATL